MIEQIQAEEDKLLNILYRQKIIEEINGRENRCRKYKSYKEVQIYNDHIERYVKEYLRKQLECDTLTSYSIISSINIASAVVNKESVVYKRKPIRTVTTRTDEEKNIIADIYEDGGFNQALSKSNRFYKYQHQSFLYPTVSDGKFKLKVLFPHYIDAIESENDAEIAHTYIISDYDVPEYDPRSDNKNQNIADYDDNKKSNKRYLVWSKKYNFVMDGHGMIVAKTGEKRANLSEDDKNLLGMIPIIDVFADKDGKFYVDKGSSLADFTIQYNAALSDSGNVVRMQSYAQAWFKGPESMLPQEVFVGANRVLFLKYDPKTDQQVDFGFSNPGADLEGAQNYTEMLVSNFLSTRGIDSTVISNKLDNAGLKFNSGLERLLYMIENYENHAEDYDIYSTVEEKIFQVIKAYLLLDSKNTLLDDDYAFTINQDTTLAVNFPTPEALQSDGERIANVKSKLENKLCTRKDAIKEIYKLNDEQASQKLLEIELEPEELDKIIKAKKSEFGDTEEINKQSLNGAQVTSMVEIVQSVASGTLPRDSGLNILIASFGLTEAQAESIMASSGKGFKINVQASAKP